MKLLFLSTLVGFWGISTAQGLLFNTYLWQLKEYRLDRILDFLKSSPGKRLLAKNLAGFTLAVTSLIPLGLPIKGYAAVFPGLAWAGLGALGLHTGFLAWKRKLPHPGLTPKALLVLGGAAGLSGITVILFGFPTGGSLGFQSGGAVLSEEMLPLAVALVVARMLVPVAVTGTLFMVYIPSELAKRRLIRRATVKCATLHPENVIGITGSYGKTTTKAFLTTILSAKQPTFSTRGGTNINVAIAREILSSLKSHHRQMVIEMGAYRDGEITAICKMVRPNIAIWTAVNEQHLSLFGTLENTMRAKYELIAALPPGGIAILNGDDERVMGKAAGWQGKKVVYSRSDHGADLYASGVKTTVEGLCFTVHFEGQSQPVETRVVGEHNLSNLLAAIAGALMVGMPLPEIAEAARQVEPLKGTFYAQTAKDGTLLVDSTHNTNPSGVRASLDYLRLFEDRKKVMLFPGIIELGEASDRIHMELGQLIAETCDVLMILKPDFANPLLAGVQRSQRRQLEVLEGAGAPQISARLQALAGPNTVILFEGRGTGRFMAPMLPPPPSGERER